MNVIELIKTIKITENHGDYTPIQYDIELNFKNNLGLYINGYSDLSPQDSLVSIIEYLNILLGEDILSKIKNKEITLSEYNDSSKEFNNSVFYLRKKLIY